MWFNIFAKPYTVRQHDAQTVIRGYASAPYTDIITRLDVQPQAPDSLDGREEGDVSVKSLKAWGNRKLTAADELTGVPGDCLFYQGAWYECKSCVNWKHTPLAHYQSDFVIMPADKQFKPPDPKPSPPELPEVKP